MITIIDYQAGNLSSVQNALKQIGVKSLVTQNPKKIAKAEKIIFPGVGAAGEAMKNLKKLKLIEPIKKYIESDRPFLGICLGAQILMEKSEEDNTELLGIIKGNVKKFKSKNLTIPHMGWNQVEVRKNNKLFKNIKSNSFFYFVHSYYLNPQQKDATIGSTIYGKKFTSAIVQNNLYAVQFHPEKSAQAGLKLLKNFSNL